MNNRFNKVFPFFDPFNQEFALESQLIDIFSSQFSFYLLTKQCNNNFKNYICLLNNIALKSSLDPIYTLIISDTSIKYHIAISILYIYIHNKLVIKTFHHAVNVITMEAKLFAIRCGINQATNLNSINKIIIITDSIHTMKRIFNPSSYSFQIYVASISDELRKFFVKNYDNLIKFWKYSSCCKWSLHKSVNKETKKFYSKPYYPCKSSLDKKEHQFLELLNDDNKPLELIYSKGRFWLKYFEHSTSLCTRATKAIVNHTPIGKY